MIQIVLEDNQNGYEVVMDYVYRYVIHHTTDDLIVSLATSNNGEKYYYMNELVLVEGYCSESYEWQNDWWEGEKYIQLFGIISIENVKIQDGQGIYEK